MMLVHPFFLLFFSSCCCICMVSAICSSSRSKESEQYAEFPPPYQNTICPSRLTSFIRNDPTATTSQLSSNELFRKYHSPTSCNQKYYNQYQNSLNRHSTIQYYNTMGSIETIPNQQTTICPIERMVTGTKSTTTKPTKTNTIGLDTTWIVENQASTLIVVAYINADGMEVSAQNPKIYPSYHDPNAILQIGQYMAINTFEGHEFIVRSYDRKTNTAGIVLLQHKVGLIPIGNNNQEYECTNTDDIEPRVPETNTIVPEYSRTKSPSVLPCNTISIGFRNTINCPIHGYYVVRNNDNNNNENNDNVCQEKFKFHLGIQNTNLNEYMFDWISTSKYEQTYIGHIFRFRLANNPDVIIDTITVSPTIIRDCPIANQNNNINNNGIRNNMVSSSVSGYTSLYTNSTATSNDGMNQVCYDKNIHLPNGTVITSSVPCSQKKQRQQQQQQQQRRRMMMISKNITADDDYITQFLSLSSSSFDSNHDDDNYNKKKKKKTKNVMISTSVVGGNGALSF